MVGRRTYCLIAAVVLHAVPLVRCADPAHTPPQGSYRVTFDIVDKTDHPGLGECANPFGGIGIQFTDWTDPTVTRVPHGYPAELAGIVKGDYIVNVKDLMGPVGSRVDVTVIKPSGEVRLLKLKRAKICTGG